MKENEEWPKRWEQHLDLHLPRMSQELLRCSKYSRVLGRQISRVNHIPINEDGVPVLPTIDVNQASMGELIQILRDYYAMLWGRLCL